MVVKVCKGNKFHEQRINKQNLSTSFKLQNESKAKDSLKPLPQLNCTRKGILKSRLNHNLSNSTFYKSTQKDNILIHKQEEDWKDEVVIGKFENKRRSDSKYSAAINDSYMSNPYHADRSLSQNSFYQTNNRTLGDRPNTSFNQYGESPTKPSVSLLRSTAGFKDRSNSIRRNLVSRGTHSTSFDLVRNYKAKNFSDSQPVYGAIDAFNRQVLKHAHEEGGVGGHGAKHIALRPLSRQSKDAARNTFYPSLMKKPRERLKDKSGYGHHYGEVF